MGLLLSVVISYAGVNEAIECVNHILSGVIPNTEPDFQDLVEYYTRLLQKSANPSTQPADWVRAYGQGYLCLTEDTNGKLNTAAVKYYDGQPNSTAILFSTKISSFGQDSVEETPLVNGIHEAERYTSTKTKTLITNTSESFSVGYRNRSPTSYENISDSIKSDSFERDEHEESNDGKEGKKLTWHYSPLSPAITPEIHLQSYEDEDRGVYSENFLRSLDGIKFRPLQRSDPSARRRSFKKRRSSSSSSKESRASREEELKMFTSLEEAEFERMNREEPGFGSTPNLSARSYSRSRSRENVKESKHDWNVQASVESADGNETTQLKDSPKQHSFEDEQKAQEVIEEEEVDFWGNSGD